MTSFNMMSSLKESNKSFLLKLENQTDDYLGVKAFLTATFKTSDEKLIAIMDNLSQMLGI